MHGRPSSSSTCSPYAPLAEGAGEADPFLAFRAFEYTRLLCELGLFGPAHEGPRDLTTLLPEDRDVRALVDRCR
jgi:hypothetical protein